jgi:mono/diheme cytochrome c family protein
MKPLALVALGATLAFGAIGVGAMAVIELGLFDTTAATPHGPIIGWAAHAAMTHSVRERARGLSAPHAFKIAEVTAGFALYDAHCALCHGGPGVARQTWVAGMTPTPPFLVDAARHWTPAQLDLLVADGVKMTAMPSWRPILSEGQMWDIVAFLEALPYVTERDYAAMRMAARRPVNPVAEAPPPQAAP